MTQALLAGLCLVVTQTAQPIDTTTGIDGCAAGRVAAMQRGYPDDPGSHSEDGGIADFENDTDVLHYFLDLEILPTTETVIGACTMTVKSKVNNLTSMQIRIRDNFTLSSVKVNNVNAAWSRIDIPTIQVTLNPPMSLNQQFDVYIAYNGAPVSRGFGSFEFDTQGGNPLICSLSEPFYAYTWWPTKDFNTDKADGDMWYTVPGTLTVAANGVLQGTDNLSGSRKRYRWKTNYQTSPYLFSVSATNYNKYTQTYDYGTGTMPVEIYLYPGSDTVNNRNAWFQSIQMMTTYAPKFGLYPFLDEKYGIYQFSFGGGMEHQTMTGQGTFSESVTAHELGHQWWGDNVTCATFNHIWLNEGFATYSEAIWLENKPGSTGTPALLAAMDARRPGSVNGSVYCPVITDINRIFSTDFTYRKGGWVLHMLRHILGDQGFFDTLAVYRAAHQGSTATTADFQAAAESVYGADLSWFFDPWIFDDGAPSYQYAWRQISVAGKNWVEVYVKQVQSASYPLFPMPIDIRTTIAAVNTTNVIWNDAAAEHLLFETTAPISGLAFDPEEWILWTGASTTTFVEGPPKIVAVSPAPGSVRSAVQAADPITVSFHKDVTINTSHVTLVGDVSGAIPFSVSYSSVNKTATIQPTNPLAGDSYTLTVKDTVLDTVAAKQLDGETADPSDPASIPTGNGLPGTNAVFRFSVQSAVCEPCDTNCDGSINLFDIDPFVALLSASPPPPCSPCAADTNNDGSINLFDITAMVECISGP